MVDLTLPGILNADLVAHLTQVMMSEVPNAPIFDWKKREVTFNETEKFSFENLFKSKVGASDPIQLNATLKAGFSGSYGKFPSAYGNVVLMDCHYIYDYLLDYLTIENDKIEFQQPITWFENVIALRAIRNDLKSSNTTLCNYTIELDGILSNKQNYYLSDAITMKRKVDDQATVMADTFSRASNYSVVTPLMSGFGSLETD